MNKYANIIHHDRPVSPQHKPMSRESRAAQFSPYAALVGHKDLITANETNFLLQEDPEHIIVLDEDLDQTQDEF